MADGKGLRAALQSGRRILGTWCILSSSTTAEIAAIAGMDFIILDLEHGVFSLPALENCIRAAEGAGASPLVRVSGLDPLLVQSVVDLGAHGIVVPQIRSAEDARAVVRAVRTAPVGTRGFNPFTRASRYGLGADPPDPLIMVIIENRDAAASLDDILAVEGIDAVYAGVYDMSVDLELNGNVHAPQVREFALMLAQHAKASGRFSGGMYRPEDSLNDFFALGFDICVCGVDADVYAQRVRSNVMAFRTAQGQSL